MNIKVQNSAPGLREGVRGELRLVVTGRGAYLYIKDNNQWFSLRVTPTLTQGTEARKNRNSFQGNALTIATDDDNHEGTILPGNGRRDQPDSGEPPDAPS